MTLLGVLGSQAVARVQSVVVFVVLTMLTVLSVVTLTNLDPHLLGFGIITFTAKDLPHAKRQLPRPMFLALGIALAGIVIVLTAFTFTTLIHEPWTALDA